MQADPNSQTHIRRVNILAVFVTFILTSSLRNELSIHEIYMMNSGGESIKDE